MRQSIKGLTMALRKLAQFLIKHSTIAKEDEAIEIIKEIRKKNNDSLVGLKKVEILSSAKKLYNNMKQNKRVKRKEADSDSFEESDERDSSNIEKDTSMDERDSSSDEKNNSINELNCTIDSSDDEDLEKGNDNHEKEARKPFTCKFCFVIFHDKQACNQHMKIYHSLEHSYFLCVLCGKVFKLQRSLVLHHKAKHSNKEKETCSLCSKEYSHRKDLQLHMKKHTGDDPVFTCDKCICNFRSKSNLYQHRQRIHSLYNINFEEAHDTLRTKDGKLQCNICKEKFKDKWKLNRHLITKICLTDEEMILNMDGLFQRKLCNNSYQDKTSLRRHHQIKHETKGAPGNVCSECGSDFSTKSSLSRHMKRKHK